MSSSWWHNRHAREVVSCCVWGQVELGVRANAMGKRAKLAKAGGPYAKKAAINKAFKTRHKLTYAGTKRGQAKEKANKQLREVDVPSYAEICKLTHEILTSYLILRVFFLAPYHCIAFSWLLEEFSQGWYGFPGNLAVTFEKGAFSEYQAQFLCCSVHTGSHSGKLESCLWSMVFSCRAERKICHASLAGSVRRPWRCSQMVLCGARLPQLFAPGLESQIRHGLSHRSTTCRAEVPRNKLTLLPLFAVLTALVSKWPMMPRSI